MALWVKETKSQTKSQHIKPNIGFPWGGKTRVPGEKPLLKNWVEKQQSQPTYQYDHGSGNRPRAISVEGRCSHHFANPTQKLMMNCNDNDSNNKKSRDLAMLLLLTDSLSMNKHLHLSLAFIQSCKNKSPDNSLYIPLAVETHNKISEQNNFSRSLTNHPGVF